MKRSPPSIAPLKKSQMSASSSTNKINCWTETTQLIWLKQHGMSREFLETVFIPRLLKIEKFKHQTWHQKLESYFLQRKRSLDRAIYSLIRVKDPEIARELYFRIQEKEQSFAELAREYSQRPEAQVNGILRRRNSAQSTPIWRICWR